MNNLDIVSLIEKNPITRLSKNYQNVLLNKIKENFNEEEQRLFVTNFYCYLNHKDDEFIIDLNKVWKWIGFSRIDPAKRVLEKNFSIDKEYKIALHKSVERKNEGLKIKNKRLKMKKLKQDCGGNVFYKYSRTNS